MKKLLSARKKKAIIYAVAAGICVSGTILVGTAKRFSMSNITAWATTTQQEQVFLKEMVLQLSIMIYQATLKAA